MNDNKSNKKERISFVDKHNANKKLSIWTSIISFVLGWIVVFYLIVIKGLTPAKDWGVALLIIVLGLSSVSMGSDLRGFLKILKGGNNKKPEVDDENS